MTSNTPITLLIDGYNLLRRGFKFDRFDLESQRALLEVHLREWLRVEPRSRIVLVYDGALGIEPHRPAPGERGGAAEPGLEVLFSTPPESADDLVLAECRRRARAGRVWVVTSDRKDIVRNLPAGGAVRHLSSERFADMLEEVAMRAPRAGVPLPVEEPAAEAEEKPTAVSEEDVRGWLDLFGEEAPDPRTTEEWLDLFDEEDEEQNAATVGEDVTAPATPAPPADDGPSEKPGALSPEEVRRWLELFSEPDGG